MESIIIKLINEVINPLIFLFFGIAILVFLYGLIVYIANTDNEEKRKVGMKHIAFGIIGFVIMMGAWGILEFIDNSLPGESSLDTFRSDIQL